MKEDGQGRFTDQESSSKVDSVKPVKECLDIPVRGFACSLFSNNVPVAAATVVVAIALSSSRAYKLLKALTDGHHLDGVSLLEIPKNRCELFFKLRRGRLGHPSDHASNIIC